VREGAVLNPPSCKIVPLAMNLKRNHQRSKACLLAFSLPKTQPPLLKPLPEVLCRTKSILQLLSKRRKMTKYRRLLKANLTKSLREDKEVKVVRVSKEEPRRDPAATIKAEPTQTTHRLDKAINHKEAIPPTLLRLSQAHLLLNPPEPQLVKRLKPTKLQPLLLRVLLEDRDSKAAAVVEEVEAAEETEEEQEEIREDKVEVRTRARLKVKPPLLTKNLS